MPKKSLHLLMVIMMLAAAALACNTVMGGGDLTPQEIAETAAALEGADANATIAAAQETADAVIGDNGDDNGDETATEEGDDNGDDNGDTGDDPFEGQGPDDIPVMDDNPELLLADDTNLSYYTDASFDDTVEFYRTAMLDAGWEASENGDVVFAGIASLQFNNADHNALVTVTTDPTSDRTFVTALVTPN